MTENRRIRPGSLLLLLLVVCVFILARSMNSSGTVAYSDMCRYFREEKVQSFTITGDVLKAKLQDGTLAACTIGSVESFYSDMDGLIQQQVQSGTVQQQDFVHATNWAHCVHLDTAALCHGDTGLFADRAAYGPHERRRCSPRQNG